MNHSEAAHLFDQMHPGFFEKEWIRGMGADDVYEEMILDLRGASVPAEVPVSLPGVTYGRYTGDMESLRACIREVDAGWPQYFDEKSEIFCAFYEGKVVSFCLLDDMGEHELGGRRVRVAGPGCVGTLPAYRRRGVGLEMIRRATLILQARGYDLSYIHYTGVAQWYAKLGYETIVKWNCRGILNGM